MFSVSLRRTKLSPIFEKMFSVGLRMTKLSPIFEHVFCELGGSQNEFLEDRTLANFQHKVLEDGTLADFGGQNARHFSPKRVSGDRTLAIFQKDFQGG